VYIGRAPSANYVERNARTPQNSLYDLSGRFLSLDLSNDFEGRFAVIVFHDCGFWLSSSYCDSFVALRNGHNVTIVNDGKNTVDLLVADLVPTEEFQSNSLPPSVQCWSNNRLPSNPLPNSRTDSDGDPPALLFDDDESTLHMTVM
jgi:hypothetical protein